MNPTTREPAEILIVDEDSLTLASATAALDSAGHIVYQARDRRSALKIANTQALDLLICDVNVGGDSGLELSREMRQLPGMQDVPVMFISRTQLPESCCSHSARPTTSRRSIEVLTTWSAARLYTGATPPGHARASNAACRAEDIRPPRRRARDSAAAGITVVIMFA